MARRLDWGITADDDTPGPGLTIRISGDVRRRFRELADQWRRETETASSPTALFMHPAYQEIIGLGPAALPSILADLAETRAHWFWALRAITGENPVPPEERGQVDAMAERWLAWGHERGLV